VRFARHDEETLGAAARGFCGHFGLERVNAVDVLPAYHVSGFMARVRCAVTGGIHLPWAWKGLEAGDCPELPLEGGWVLSLVPTQLQRLLGGADAARGGRGAQSGMPGEHGARGGMRDGRRARDGRVVEWLRRFEVIFLGGGPVWPSLTDAAAREGLRVSLCYGMTETAAMVAALRPGEFAGGARSCGAVLPHARVELVDEETGEVHRDAGSVGRVGRVGRVRIVGASVCRGYLPESAGAVESAGGAEAEDAKDARSVAGAVESTNAAGAEEVADVMEERDAGCVEEAAGTAGARDSRDVRSAAGAAGFGGVLMTEDMAFFDARGWLNIVGRRDAVIITGGKKVLPGEVEAVLRSSGGFSDVAVVGVPDAEWGERVVACYPGGEGAVPDWEAVGRALRSLSGYKRPVRFVPMTPWPRTAQGKVNRARLRAFAAATE
jgi:O-succinylbenzoic acid--CoA ligase